jgi:hypothetical protein
MQMQYIEIQWSRLERSGDLLDVTCDEDGPAIGPVRLLRRTPFGLEPRATTELEFILGTALGWSIHLAAKTQGLRTVANALQKGDLAHAMLVTQFLWLPSLPDKSAFERAVRADSLAKGGFSSSESRDDHGRWTDDGSLGAANFNGTRSVETNNPDIVPVGGFAIPEGIIPWLEQVKPARPLPATPPFPGEILPPAVGVPDIAVPRTLDNPYPEDRGCAGEWENAKKYCRELDDAGKLGVGDYRNHGKIFGQCVRGQVSARCGGSPVDWGAGA